MEQYSVYEQRSSLEFETKDTEANHDYLVDFAPMLPVDTELSSAVVTIEAAGNTESPIGLNVRSASAAPNVPPVGSPALNTAVLFWLVGGSTGVRYQGKIKVTVNSGSSPSPPARVLIKRFLIVVEGYESFGSPDDDRGSPNDSSPPHDWDHPQW